MEINKQNLFSHLIFNREVKYNDCITLYPITMKHILEFQQFSPALTLRKDSIFQEKQIIKMGYFDFIKYAYQNNDLATQYEMPYLPFYYEFVLAMLQLSCGDDAEIKHDIQTHDVYVNGFEITNEVFDDLRRIIIIQNDIDYDDQFMNIDTIKALEKAREFEKKKNKESADIEDYIDSLIVGLKVTEDYVSKLTIRKFWRYIKRFNKHEEYEAYRSGQMSGMVTFKEPLTHWMTTLDIVDKYENLKTDEGELRSKIG